MSRTLVVELPDDAHAIIERTAQACDRKPEEIASEWLLQAVDGSHAPSGGVSARRNPTAPCVDRGTSAQNGVRSFFGAWAGPLDSSDNERIDADLAREYGGKSREDG